MNIIITTVEEVGESKIRVSAVRILPVHNNMKKLILASAYGAMEECQEKVEKMLETLKNDTREPFGI